MEWMLAGNGARYAVQLIRAHWKTALVIAAFIAAWELIWGPHNTQDAGAMDQQAEWQLEQQMWDARELARQHPDSAAALRLRNSLENELLTKQLHLEPLEDHGSR